MGPTSSAKSLPLPVLLKNPGCTLRANRFIENVPFSNGANNLAIVQINLIRRRTVSYFFTPSATIQSIDKSLYRALKLVNPVLEPLFAVHPRMLGWPGFLSQTLNSSLGTICTLFAICRHYAALLTTSAFSAAVSAFPHSLLTSFV